MRVGKRLRQVRRTAVSPRWYTLAQAAIGLFRDNLKLVRIGIVARGHVVMAGLGSTGSRLVRALDDSDRRVVVIERDGANPGIVACRDRGISVLIGDARDELLLAHARLSRADQMFIACGDDRIDMDIAAAATSLVSESAASRRPGEVLTVFVALDDLRLWRGLSARMLTSRQPPGVQLELFHVYEAAAKKLVEAHPPFLPDEERPHVVLVGASGVGEALILRVARQALARSRELAARLRVTILGPSADEERDWLVVRYPDLDDVCELHACRNSLEDGDLPSAARAIGGEPSSVYVCLENESDALASALALARLAEFAGVRIVVTLQDSDAGMANALEQTRREEDRVAHFGVLTSALTGGLLLSGVTELLAQAKHEEYVRSEEQRGMTPEDNPSMRPWEELSTSLKAENRAFVGGIAEKLEMVGCTLAPSPLADPANPSFEFTSDQLELLARQEHERWMDSRRRQGYTYGPVRRDDGRAKHHPLLVDFADLPPAEQDKDRSPVRQLPMALANAGFEVIRGDGAPSPRPLTEQS